MMEYIILQPLQTRSESLNVSLIERKYHITPEEEKLILHEAGGPFAGFIVKKLLPLQWQPADEDKCDLSFKLNVYMRHASSTDMQQEQRVIQFWFATASDRERMTCSNSFFHNLFKGDNFPKDYFMFLLKIMQIFKVLKPVRQLRIEIEKVGAPQPLNAPINKITSSVMHLKAEYIREMSIMDPKQYAAIISAKILEFLERAFPNTISVDELARLTDTEFQLVFDFLRDLLDRGLVKYYDNGNNWIRNIVNTQEENTHEVIQIQQQPTVSNDDQPTIAIITVNYYEKMAVDAMMSNKVTFVRHKPEGESNVYTIGNIGDHRVVSTKLPLLGRDSRSAKISSGNTTTRLLGIFQRVEHVILVGCAGAVPHYSDYTRHPRRGDIVVSFPESSPDAAAAATAADDSDDYVYAHFELQKQSSGPLPNSGGGGGSQIISKSWMPASMEMYRIVNSIRKSYNPRLNKKYPWEVYLDEGIRALNSDELDCRRPVDDKLFFTVGDKNIIEVSHPEDATGTHDRRQYMLPTLRFGKIGGGERLVRDENLRHALSEQHGIMCFDCDMDQVMESIEGNRKDSFIVIRSIVDYYDGTTSKEWQPYAALCAAAFAKTIICALPVPVHSPY